MLNFDRIRAEVDLRWFWTEAEGALGLRAAPIERSPGGTGEPDTWAIHEAAWKRSGAVLRWRRVHARLEVVGRAHEYTLRAVYEPREWPGCGCLGQLAGVAVLLALEGARPEPKAAPFVPPAPARRIRLWHPTSVAPDDWKGWSVPAVTTMGVTWEQGELVELPAEEPTFGSACRRVATLLSASGPGSGERVSSLRNAARRRHQDALGAFVAAGKTASSEERDR